MRRRMRGRALRSLRVVVFFISPLRLSLTQCALNNSIGSLPRADSDSLVRVELENARISTRISASRSGASGARSINVIDAADLKLCLLLHLFWPKSKESVQSQIAWPTAILRPARPHASCGPPTFALPTEPRAMPAGFLYLPLSFVQKTFPGRCSIVSASQAWPGNRRDPLSG